MSYSNRTVVQSCSDGVDVFTLYTDFYDTVFDIPNRSAKLLLLPCGKTKPIGTSSFQAKIRRALINTGFFDECDVYIISEPCTIIPYNKRFDDPAVNYDYPPKFAKKDICPEVNKIFVNRLSTWLDYHKYPIIYPYLFEHHVNILEQALEKITYEPYIRWVPTSVVNRDTNKRYGDMFGTQEQIERKLINFKRN